jgi:GNAT superfamily N-acetyltransferase
MWVFRRPRAAQCWLSANQFAAWAENMRLAPRARGRIQEVSANAVTIRHAERRDLPAIVSLYASDELHGASEPGPDLATGCDIVAGYVAAFEEMADDPNNCVYVAEHAGAVVGTCQLTFIRQLSYGGCLVAQLESVYVKAEQRSHGVGQRLIENAISKARQRGALRVQLTTNLRRVRAHRFYERLGFRATHHGMKLYLRDLES